MKDRFSSLSKAYAQYRPQYPPKLFENIFKHVQKFERAWDAGTGNGQVAAVLADHFAIVEATDISAQQLQQAINKPNILYSIMPAEQTTFPPRYFDLVTVAQAIHWFRFADFYKEVQRVLKPGGVLAVWGYGLLTTGDEMDTIIQQLYKSLQQYWDDERRHIEDSYANIGFPYPEIGMPAMSITVQWNQQQLLGYLHTWSGAKLCQQKTGNDPVQAFAQRIATSWGDENMRTFRFPLFTKVGINLAPSSK